MICRMRNKIYTSPNNGEVNRNYIPHIENDPLKCKKKVEKKS